MENNYSKQFKKGAFEMILLALISQKETYGYEIISELNRRGGGIFGCAKEGTVYPILYRLQEAGLLCCRVAPSSANGGLKKYYSLSARGVEALRELAAFWGDYKACVDTFLNGGNFQ